MNTINDENSVTAFAPATCANVAVGFDVLGFALDAVGDVVTLTRRADKQIVIEAIEAKEALPQDAAKNTASLVIQKLCADLKLNIGFSIAIKKGIPLSSGMGGSAASAVAALVACNAFLTKPLSLHELAQYALLGEELASGQQHADNIVPCLFGGMTLIHAMQPIAIVQLPIPKVYCVLIHPHLHVSTMQARKLLQQSVSLTDYVKQSANLAAFIAALYTQDLELLQTSMTDVLIEPQRAQLIPGFYQVKSAAMAAGAMSMAISGSGPSLFAFAKDKSTAEAISKAMCAEFGKQNIAADSWLAPISQQAARVL